MQMKPKGMGEKPEGMERAAYRAGGLPRGSGAEMP